MRRSRFFLTIAAGAALTLVLPSAAAAAPALVSGEWIVASYPQPVNADYVAQQVSPYWSAVVLQPGYQQGSGADINQNYDLFASDATGNQLLASSTQTPAELDYIAVDSNSPEARTPHTMRVHRAQGTGTSEQYRLTYAATTAVLVAGRTKLVPPPGAQPNNAYIRDIYVQPNATVTVFAGGEGQKCPSNVGTLYLHAFLLGSTAAGRSVVQSRADALAESFSLQQRGADCGVTVSYKAPKGGWYGLLIVDPAFASPFVDVTIG